MSAFPHDARPSALAAVAGALRDFFVAPAGDPRFDIHVIDDCGRSAPIATFERVVVAGLGPRVGASTLSRALAVELAQRRGSAAVVRVACLPRRGQTATRAARKLAVAFGDGEGVRATGRLCLVAGESPIRSVAAAARYLAPLTVDWPYGAPVSAAAELEALVLLVASPATDPALAAAAAELAGPRARVILNRAGEWRGRAAAAVPDARVAARLAGAGLPVAGAFAAAIERIADGVAAG